MPGLGAVACRSALPSRAGCPVAGDAAAPTVLPATTAAASIAAALCCCTASSGERPSPLHKTGGRAHLQQVVLDDFVDHAEACTWSAAHASAPDGFPTPVPPRSLGGRHLRPEVAATARCPLPTRSRRVVLVHKGEAHLPKQARVSKDAAAEAAAAAPAAAPGGAQPRLQPAGAHQAVAVEHVAVVLLMPHRLPLANLRSACRDNGAGAQLASLAPRRGQTLGAQRSQQG